MAVNSRIVRADESGAAVEGDRFTEAVISRTVAGGELLRLTPGAIRLGENIERALTRVGADGGARRTDEYGRAFQRDSEAKVVIGGTIICCEILPLWPSDTRLV